MNNQVNKNIRKVIEGVVINDYFLSLDEFKDFFERALSNNQNNPLNLWRETLKSEIDFLDKNYDTLIKQAPMYAYTIWENITAKYFNNTPVSILAATNLDASQNTEIYANKVESVILSKNSQNKLQVDKNKLSNSNITGNITADVATTMIKNHYQRMARTIIHGKPNDKEIDHSMNSTQLSDYQKSRLSKAKNTKDIHKRYHFYQQVFGQINYGKIWEAYIHHLAHWHGWYLTIKQLNNISVTSARIEEYPGFLTLLYNANNGYSFTRGGDIIITDNTRKVITNVQIKGNKTNDVVYFGNPVSTKTTKNMFLKPLKEILNSKKLSEDVIEELFNKLKNEAWVEKNVDEAVQKVNIDQLIKEINDNFIKHKNLSVIFKQDF